MSGGLLLFGGSFNPIHNGHLRVSRAAGEQLGVSRIVLIPSANPPHKRNGELAPPAQRLDLCRLAVADDPFFEVSDWELRQAGPNYTLLTVRHFRETHPSERLYWLIGQDSLLDLPTWYRVGELADLCTLTTAGRPGYSPRDLSFLKSCLTDAQIETLRRHILPTPLVDISATEIRRRVAGGESIDELVPAAVAEYIVTKRCYRDG